MRKPQKYFYENEYLTIDEIFEKTGLKRTTVIGRLKMSNQFTKKVTIPNKEIIELQKEYNLSHEGVRYRIKHDIPFDAPVRKKKYIYENKKMTLKEIGDLFNICPAAVLKRIKKGTIKCEIEK